MLVPGNPAVIWNTSGRSSGASGETCDFLCISSGFAHARFAWLPGTGRLQKDTESKEVPEQMAPVNLLRSGFCQKWMNFHCFERFTGNSDRFSVPSDPLPHIPRRHPKSAKETFVFLCFSNGFRRAPLQSTGIRVVHSGPRSAPLDLLRSRIFQIRFVSYCLGQFFG